MENSSIKRIINERLRLRGQRLDLFSSRGWRLIVGAALLHVVLAAGLFVVGRAQVAPILVDRDGIMESFAKDSYDYRREALGLSGLLNASDPGTETAETEHAHVKVLSLEFAIFGRLLGYSILSAEPFNLFCYVAILSLVMMLGREMGSKRIGLFAAGIVALWPTFLLHTMQFLKDPPFIAAALALILIVMTWLTRTYSWSKAVISGAALAVTAGLLLLIRIKFSGFIFVIVFFGFGCLIVRQLLERRVLYWNLICPALILTVAVPTAFYLTATNQKLKRYPSDQSGSNKSSAVDGKQLSTLISYGGRTSFKTKTPSTYAPWLSESAETVAQRIGATRYNFNISYPESGSSIDRNVEFKNFKDLLLYLPRALAIGLWAPFPDMWVGAGKRVGSAGRLLSGAETLLMYLCELLALLTLWRAPRDLANWLLLSISAFGVTALGLVVSNVGTLYRIRYLFWILLIILGVKGLESILARRRAGRSVPPQGKPSESLSRNEAGVQRANRRLAAIVMSVCVVACAACASCGGSAVASTGALDFTLINLTGSTIRAVYVSPHDSAGWEENVLGQDKLFNGETVKIRFRPEEQSVVWDLRVEVRRRSTAEWKNLNLREISKITLRIGEGQNVVMAEAE